MRIAQILIFSVALFRFSIGKKDHDPHFAFKIPFKRSACPPSIRPYLVSCDQKLYEGRWYVKYLMETNNEKCMAFDLVPDESNSTFVVASAIVDEKFGWVVVERVPKRGKLGLFADLFTPDGTRINATCNYFYTDAEMLIVYDRLCTNDGHKHYKNVVVAFRDLNWVEDKESQLRRILEKLKGAIGKFELSTIHHDEKCEYLSDPKEKINRGKKGEERNQRIDYVDL